LKKKYKNLIVDRFVIFGGKHAMRVWIESGRIGLAERRAKDWWSLVRGTARGNWESLGLDGRSRILRVQAVLLARAHIEIVHSTTSVVIIVVGLAYLRVPVLAVHLAAVVAVEIRQWVSPVGVLWPVVVFLALVRWVVALVNVAFATIATSSIAMLDKLWINVKSSLILRRKKKLLLTCWWIDLCTINVLDWQNPLPHTVHLNGFSFECTYLVNNKTISFRSTRNFIVCTCFFDCLPVVSEMILSAEGLAADIARIRTLVSMRTLVDQQVVRLGEVSRAELAYVLLALSLGHGLLSQALGFAWRGRRGARRSEFLLFGRDQGLECTPAGITTQARAKRRDSV
jgi:hypothetical protein